MQTREQSEMDVSGISEATETWGMEVLCEAVGLLPLGIEVAAGGHGDGVFFWDFTRKLLVKWEKTGGIEIKKTEYIKVAILEIWPLLSGVHLDTSSLQNTPQT